MKRCPSCDRTFEDESQMFCLNDGTGLVADLSSAPGELLATMMATPPSLGGSSFPPPPAPDPSQFNPPPPSWAPPATPKIPLAPKSGGMNKTLIFGGLGCLGLVVIIGIVGIVVLFAFSGPSSKMNPYKGDLKELAPEKVETYTRIDVDVLGDNEKSSFGIYKEAIGVAYKEATDEKLEMLIANYSSPKDAEDGLKIFKAQNASRGWTISEEGKKTIGWRTVGLRFIGDKTSSTGQVDERYLPDGATILLAQTADTAKEKKQQFICWTNGSVLFAVAGENNRAKYFEKAFDKTVK